MGFGEITFTDIGSLPVTFKTALPYDAKVKAGNALAGQSKPVKLDNTGVVAATDGSLVLGELLQVEDGGACSVKVKGFMKFARTGAAQADLGKAIVGAAGGEVRPVNTAVAAELGVARGVIVDYGADFVWVLL